MLSKRREEHTSTSTFLQTLNSRLKKAVALCCTGDEVESGLGQRLMLLDSEKEHLIALRYSLISNPGCRKIVSGSALVYTECGCYWQYAVYRHKS